MSTTDTETAPIITIAEVKFEVGDKYEEGHSLDENEAAALNQLRRENLRNNFRKTVETLQGEGKSEDEIRAAFAAYADEYTFSGRRQSAAPKDPVEAEARKIARTVVTAALKEQNYNLKELRESGQLDKLVEKYAAKPDVMDEARRRVEGVKAIAAEAIGDIS